MEIMLKNIVEAAASRGLHVHPDKSKVLTNAWRTSKNKVPNNLHAGGQCFAVLPEEGSVKYLGRKVSFHDPNEVEISNRIASSWATFSKHKEELTDKRYRLKDRLKLFNATVTACALYGCETWALRVDQQRRLQATQRKMLRLILNAKRRKVYSTDDAEGEADTEKLEEWSEFLRRAARLAEEQLQSAGVKEWLQISKQRKAAWAAKLERQPDKWSARATLWCPLLHSSSKRGRPQAHPCKRWSDDFKDTDKN